ncbi:phosphatidylglycerophosphatase A [Moraxella sp. VT-16-12]|uniref:phosphatidylglycerophosphatase A family protein n=1 Tax=Moraxella sp. VT-16-12 TaxID=2014877 RepID=UPI000B802204|nr:phosphatidylglycerophosphatase A [Moraxella sp. VT-16-12]TWV84667.1 phosphatidylglycerophosphatase A [Moraxella sp. VT-16-12]
MQHKPDIKKSNPCPPCPSSASIFEKCVYWLGVGLGSGLPKKAPGTWGTVGGLMVALPMLLLGFWGFLIITVIGCLVGSYICGKTSELMGVHDDPHIVFDEWVGMWIALLPSVWLMFGFVPDDKAGLAYLHPSLALLFVIPFVLFRFFDIIKPFPIKWVDSNVSGGFGILIDDVLAGIMSAAVFVVMMAVFN